jgi:N-acetylglucosaminyldiphosphoundecaprenol N-acetyl-beta-D-mannosaminyltransferase
MKRSTTDTVALFGLPITNVTMAQAVARIEQYILSGKTHQIATANLDFARNALRDEFLQRIICECRMVLPDGAPMLWASSLFGAPLQERVTGVDLIPELARLSAERGYGLYFLGSSEYSSRTATELLQQRYPGVNIVGRYSPEPRPLNEMDHEEMLRRIEAAQPDILLVAFGNPKQEVWIYRHRDRLRVPIAIGIGGALDMIAGSLRRAPKWVQKAQLEWLFRMLQEPKRLLPRYANDAAALLVHLPLGLLANNMQPVERRHGGLQVEVQQDVRVVATPARLSGNVCAWLAREATAAAAAGQSMVLDMSATIRVEADGLGGLLEARRILLAEGLWIWLTAMSNPVRRVLQFSAMADLFRLALTPADAIRLTTAASRQSSRGGEQMVPARMKSSTVQTNVAKAS